MVALATGIHELGPDNSRLVVKTYREGVASRAGHDLIIEVRRWKATLDVAGQASQWSLELEADARSLYPSEGLGGVKPLSDRDRDEIVRNIDEKVVGSEPISFRSSSVARAGDDERLTVRGELTMRGQTRPASFELSVDGGGGLAGAATLAQSEWGIKPYRGLMGALKVRDTLEVVFEGRLPTASG